MPLTAEVLFPHVAAAIENKYADERSVDVKVYVGKALQASRDLKSAEAIAALAKPASSLVADVWNQTLAYAAIENVWRLKPPSSNILEKLYSILVGRKEAEIAYRTESFIKDFGGSPPTAVERVAAEAARINARLLREIAQKSKEPIVSKARYLAEIFADIIRVHPFPDGNGRTARLAVQFCLRFWGMPYAVIPKIRNDEAWREAVVASVAGDCDALSARISRLIEAPTN